MDFKCEETLHKSLTYIIRVGHRIDSCGSIKKIYYSILKTCHPVRSDVLLTPVRIGALLLSAITAYAVMDMFIGRPSALVRFVCNMMAGRIYATRNKSEGMVDVQCCY